MQNFLLPRGCGGSWSWSSDAHCALTPSACIQEDMEGWRPYITPARVALWNSCMSLLVRARSGLQDRESLVVLRLWEEALVSLRDASHAPIGSLLG